MLPKALFNGYNNDREIKNLEDSGFQVIEDLVPLYRMVYNLQSV